MAKLKTYIVLTKEAKQKGFKEAGKLGLSLSQFIESLILEYNKTTKLNEE